VQSAEADQLADHGSERRANGGSDEPRPDDRSAHGGPADRRADPGAADGDAGPTDRGANDAASAADRNDRSASRSHRHGMKAEPQSVLALIYWLHMLATVAWVGSLASLALVVVPTARRVLDAGQQAAFLGQAQLRLQNLGWFSLGLLTVTGLFQMSSSPNYRGFLAIANPWAVAILSKHLAVGVMVAVNVYLAFMLTPARRRAELRQSKGMDTAGALSRLLRQEQTLLWINLGLSGLVLALTAVARTS